MPDGLFTASTALPAVRAKSTAPNIVRARFMFALPVLTYVMRREFPGILVTSPALEGPVVLRGPSAVSWAQKSWVGTLGCDSRCHPTWRVDGRKARSDLDHQDDKADRAGRDSGR